MCPVHKVHFFRVLAYNVSPPNVVSNDVQRLSLDSFDSTTHTKQSYGHYFIRNKKNIITTIQEDFRLIVSFIFISMIASNIIR